jgi:hypothetical protein
MNIYTDLTRRFNHGRLRAVLSSGQAVVLHRVAIMSKDGDWIIREDTEATRHVLAVALDAERRAMIRANEDRLRRYALAASDWATEWPDVERETAGLSLLDAHDVIRGRAEGVLPFTPAGGGDQ